MFWEVHKALISLLVVFCNLHHIQGCPLVCLNGGSIVGVCGGCKCASQWSGYDCSVPCGGNFSSATGYITSPEFPMNYRNDQKCRWIVYVPSTSTVVLSFKFFDTEKNSDYLRVYKGETTDSDLVGEYHGYGIPYETIMERSFLIVFTSDGSVTDEGFYLYWNTYEGYIPKFLNAVNGDHIHTIVKGDKVSLKCDAVGMPEPKIVWKKHGFRIAQNDNSFVELRGNELTFLHVNETDAGWYTCEAGNYLGKVQRSYQLTVHVFPILIQNPDSIHFEPFVEYVQQAVFWCQVYGIPDPDVNWRKDGVPIENTSTYFTKGSQWLLIPRINLADLGNYSCYVNNSLGHVESDLATLSASNATDSYFRFWLIYTTLTPILHQRALIYIRCYSCFDSGTFKIYKNGIYLNTSADDRIDLYTHYFEFHFTVSYVTEVDFGIYEILFVDRGISWFTVIDVQVPPMTSITTIDDGLNYVYNKPTISCQSNIVNSKPTFVWFKNGVAINSTWDGYKISGDYFKSYLTLQNYPSNQHDGVYNCTAINVAGKSTASIAVTVQVIDGWIESNRGSECSVSCGSDYGVVIVERVCSTSGVRCVGPSVYAQACLGRSVCPTNADATSPVPSLISTRQTSRTKNYAATYSQTSPYVRTQGPTQVGKEELSRGAVAGISVTVTAITAVLICLIIFYVILNHLRKQISSRADESATSENTHAKFPFRKRPQDGSNSRGDSNERSRTICLPPLPATTVDDSEQSEIELEERYQSAPNEERVNANPAYGVVKSGRSDEQNTYDTTYPIYETTP